MMQKMESEAAGADERLRHTHTDAWHPEVHGWPVHKNKPAKEEESEGMKS